MTTIRSVSRAPVAASVVERVAERTVVPDLDQLRPVPISSVHEAELTGWEGGTRVRAGVGAADVVGAETAALGRRALLVTDRRLAASSAFAALRSRCAFARVATAVYDAVEPDPDLWAVEQAAAALRREHAQVVVAFGGGSVLDVAKTAAWAAHNPGLLGRLEWRDGLGSRPSGAGAAPLRPALPTVALATSVGSGAEVSAVACLSAGRGGATRLLVDAALRPTVALCDPALTRTLLRRQLFRGAFQTLSRLLVPFLTDARGRALEDELAFALMRTTVRAARAAAADPGDADARLTLATAAIASQLGWANSGRPAGGHLLWYLANALSPAAGSDKVSALAALTPAYLAAVEVGAAEGLGSSGRLARAGAEALGTNPTPAAARRGFVELLNEWGLPASTRELDVAAPPDPAALPTAARALWGDPSLLGAVPAPALRAIFAAAARRPSGSPNDATEQR